MSNESVDDNENEKNERDLVHSLAPPTADKNIAKVITMIMPEMDSLANGLAGTQIHRYTAKYKTYLKEAMFVVVAMKV